MACLRIKISLKSKFSMESFFCNRVLKILSSFSLLQYIRSQTSGGSVCCLGIQFCKPNWWGKSKSFIWDHLHWSVTILRTTGKKLAKISLKFLKSEILSFIYVFWTIFWVTDIEAQHKPSIETTCIDLWPFWVFWEAKKRSK